MVIHRPLPLPGVPAPCISKMHGDCSWLNVMIDG